MPELQPPEVEAAYQEIAAQSIGHIGQAILGGLKEYEPDHELTDAERALKYGSEQAMSEAYKFELAAREVVHFVLSGLEAGRDNPRDLFDLRVRYNWEAVIGDHEPLVNEDGTTIAGAIGRHPRTEELGPKFAADVALRTARLLTPEIVGLVLDDTTRTKPTIRTISQNTEQGLVRTREVVNG